MLKINKTSLLQTFIDFYTISGIRVAVYDSDYEEVMAYPIERIPLCTIIRQSEEVVKKCNQCDKQALEKCNKTRKPWIYKCHAGLVEVATPIIKGAKIVGYAMFGQILDEKDIPNKHEIIEKNFPEGRFPGVREAIDVLKWKSRREVEAAATILESLTLYLLSNNVIIPDEDEFAEQIDNYIEDNIGKRITADDISIYMGLSRAKLFEISKQYLSVSLSDYIKEKRIKHAKKLLVSTEMNISEIADACGFGDYVYFSKVFKENTGMSAREYKNNYKYKRSW